MINLYPEKCNLCGGQVIYTSNAIIYGREYGSGKCYYCTNCHAYVGTHVPRPKEALGILADANMRNQKIKCHAMFDELWKHEDTGKKRHKKRVEAYKWLALLGVSRCDTLTLTDTKRIEAKMVQKKTLWETLNIR